ncbi:MAG: DUF5916 domain-containing protein, partial [Bacteroidota bacterium]
MPFCKILIFNLFVFICFISAYSQHDKKQIQAISTTTPIKVDGILSETEWQNVPVAKDFTEFSPNNGSSPYCLTEVRFLYDQSALYVGAILYDNNPDSILKELSVRDDDYANSDFFSVDLCPYNDGINAYEFKIYASGVQSDMKYGTMYNSDNEENGYKNWDGVWQSAVKITDQGWIVEMKIPYSAIRFPETSVQKWGLNMFRSIRRNREISTWSFVDVAKENILIQSGELIGIENVKPPLRLSVLPYISGYLQNESQGNTWDYYFNGGMDLKYGLNESFTLDMTLVPDFGQIQSDDEIYNLSPFEVMYDEKRSFFTEGTELFNKCDIFYSRRIGEEPENYPVIENDSSIKEIVHNPDKTKLINASKFSGRTKSGLGIGIFNAMTSESKAEVIDTNDIIKFITTQPFTNYNLIVLDQNLWKSSYVSLINTHVNKTEYNANVTGTEFYFTDPKNVFAIKGNLIGSQKYFKNSDDIFGYKYSLELGKVSGTLNYLVGNNLKTDKYDPNDMGINLATDVNEYYLQVEHHIYKPFWKCMEMHNELIIEHSNLYKPSEFAFVKIEYNLITTFTNYLTFSLFTEDYPVGFKDYFEPRVPGRFIDMGNFYIGGVFFSSDYRKTLALDSKISTWKGNFFTNPNGISLMLRSRIRISDKMLLVFMTEYDISDNEAGYVDHTIDSIYFGKRNVKTITNTVSTSYIFNPLMSLNLRVRHYWSEIDYNTFYNLENDGSLTAVDYYENQDISFNAFTADIGFKWYFAPGSELNIVWKNAIYNTQNIIVRNYFDNLVKTFDFPQVINFSIKLMYYLDYQYLIK